MKLIPAVMTIALLLTTSTWALADDRSAVERVVRDNLKAFAAGDFAATENLWAHDDELLVFESGHANQGWKDYSENHLKPELRQLKGIQIDVSDLNVHPAGRTAWVTYKYTYAVTIKDKTIKGSAVATSVLEKRAGRWVIVHSHSSSVRDGM